jgi:hypothetical protein
MRPVVPALGGVLRPRASQCKTATRCQRREPCDVSTSHSSVSKPFRGCDHSQPEYLSKLLYLRMMHRVSTGSSMTRSSIYYFSIFRQRKNSGLLETTTRWGLMAAEDRACEPALAYAPSDGSECGFTRTWKSAPSRANPAVSRAR